MNLVSKKVLISEVGPRDGLQSIQSIMPTEFKKEWIAALYKAGIEEIEVGSFVSPKLLPQLADTAEIVKFAKTLDHLKVMALVPNLKGAQAAFESGVHKITIPVSASESHSLANVRKTISDMLAEVHQIVLYRNQFVPHIQIEIGISTAFGCTLQGVVLEDDVIRIAHSLAEMGVDEVGLSDTTGYANPGQVKRLFRRLKATIGERSGAAHMHNTRGLGLANCLAAFEEGVIAFDASIGGLGGCPYAPGASGNVVTEDLVFMFEAMGVDTGVNIEALIETRKILQQALPNELVYGMLAEAGVPKNFHTHSDRVVK